MLASSFAYTFHSTGFYHFGIKKILRDISYREELSFGLLNQNS